MPYKSPGGTMVPVSRPTMNSQNQSPEAAEGRDRESGTGIQGGDIEAATKRDQLDSVSIDSLKKTFSPSETGPSSSPAITAKTPTVAPAEASPCDQLFRGLFGREIKDYSKEILRSCGDEYFSLDQIKFFDLKVHRAGLNYRVKHGRQLMKAQGSYRLAQYFYPILIQPPPGLRLLIDEVQKRNGGKKIPLVLEDKVIRGSLGYFKGVHRGVIHLFDNLSQPKKLDADSGLMDQSTLSHEMGHHLMYYLYDKKFPSYEGHRGHDAEAKRNEDAVTNLGAAWSEGFANAMGNLDGHSYGGIYSPRDLSDQWFEKGLRARLSNEHVISAVLTQYIMSLERRGHMNHVVFNDESKVRVKKILVSMEAAGRQASFQEFVSDLVADFPEEADRLNPLLKKFGYPELVLSSD